MNSEKSIAVRMLLFGYDSDNSKEHDDIRAAADKAYGDMARHTLHIVDSSAREELKNQGIEKLVELIRSGEKTKGLDFDKWHKNACESLRQIYTNQTTNDNGTLTYGQAQKWVNMTIKYLDIIYAVCGFDDCETPLERVAHLPIDSIMFDIVKKKLGIKKPSKSWSKWDNYSEYLDYQHEISDAIVKIDSLEEYGMISLNPLQWEMLNWSPK